jgi:hypothetical protein
MATGAVGARAASTALALPVVLSCRSIHHNSVDVAAKQRTCPIFNLHEFIMHIWNGSKLKETKKEAILYIYK